MQGDLFITVAEAPVIPMLQGLGCLWHEQGQFRRFNKRQLLTVTPLPRCTSGIAET